MLSPRERPFRTIMDVGSNTGQFAKKISKIFPKAKLFCFEPLPEPYRYAVNLIQTYGNDGHCIFLDTVF